jgi:hypothetical protein
MTHDIGRKALLITLIHAPGDTLLADRLSNDLAAAGYEISRSVSPGMENLAIYLISPHSSYDSGIQRQLEGALDAHQHVIPIIAAPAQTPHLINNLQRLDFSEGRYPIDSLLARIQQLSAPDAPRPMTTLTTTRRRANRRTGYVLLGLVLLLFAAGLYLVGSGIVQFPTAEYDIQETARVDQRNTVIAPTIDPWLPRSTSDAASFDLTVTAAPTRLREFMAQTATSYVVGTKTPEPTWTMTPTY